VAAVAAVVVAVEIGKAAHAAMLPLRKTRVDSSVRESLLISARAILREVRAVEAVIQEWHHADALSAQKLK
jgi:hypothetical protein